jgi:hypothetical protein
MLKAQIVASLGIIMCGQVIFWRRRDNIFGYFQAGLFFASVLIPVLGTTIIDAADPEVVGLYARILLLGAAAHLVGLCYGATLGWRSRQPTVTFSRPFDDVPNRLHRRVRWAAALAVVALALAFYLLGYAPLLAADQVAAKYGVGAYAGGFARGAQVFRIALTLASAITGVLLAVIAIRRRRLDVVLVLALGIGMTLTLARGQALAGPLAFLIAWGIERRWRPWHLLTLVCLAFVGGVLLNELIQVNAPVASPSFSNRVAGTVPDISDHLGFLQGFGLQGSEHVGMKTVRAGWSLNVSKGHWDPSDYALRIRTGLSDVSELAAGGLRLPAPIWGYSAFGYAGTAVWSLLSGVVVGWGTTSLRRLLGPLEAGRHRHQALNLTLAWVFYNGTFGVLSVFYFATRADVVVVGLAVLLGLLPLGTRRLRPGDERLGERAGRG